MSDDCVTGAVSCFAFSDGAFGSDEALAISEGCFDGSGDDGGAAGETCDSWWAGAFGVLSALSFCRERSRVSWVIKPAKAIRKTASAVPTILNVVNEPPNPVSARILTKMSKALLTCSLLIGIFGSCLRAPEFDVLVSVSCVSTAWPLATGVKAAVCEPVVAACSVTFSVELPVVVASVTEGKADSTTTGNIFSSTWPVCLPARGA